MISIDVKKARVSAKSRKLKAHWTVSSMDSMALKAEGLKELMRTVGIDGYKLSEDESTIVLDILWSSYGSGTYVLGRVYNLISRKLLKNIYYHRDTEEGLVTVSPSHLLEQEFKILENYQSL